MLLSLLIGVVAAAVAATAAVVADVVIVVVAAAAADADVCAAAAHVSMCDLVVRFTIPYVWDGLGGVYNDSVSCCQPWNETLSFTTN